jgi:SAM-dependent methyltransferase
VGPASGAGEDALLAFYERQDEGLRLTYREGWVELVRTRELLRAVLPAPAARILDVGGADGAHAGWLHADGHRVEIVDLVPSHVERARTRGLTARVGDARSLEHDDATFDVVLLLGPLYHLRERADRLQALAEARRVLRPGGLLAAAAVSRIAVALDWLRKGVFTDPALRPVAARIVEVGYDDTGWGEGVFYFHTAGELFEEITAAGFRDVQVRGVEGPAWPATDPTAAPDDPVVDQVLTIARLADTDPSTVGASAHVLAVATS